MTKDNQDLTKVYQLIQQENRWNRVSNFIQTALVLLPTLLLLWKSFKPKKLTPKQRLMRIEAAMARLQLEREHVRQEAVHEAELKQMETGLDLAESKLDLLSGLQKKGEGLLKQKINQATDKLKVDKIFNKDKKE